MNTPPHTLARRLAVAAELVREVQEQTCPLYVSGSDAGRLQVQVVASGSHGPVGAEARAAMFRALLVAIHVERSGIHPVPGGEVGTPWAEGSYCGVPVYVCALGLRYADLAVA